MNRVFVLSVCLFGVARADECHLQILKGSKLLGYATVSQRILPSGGKTVEMRMELGKTNGAPQRLHKVSTYDSSGRPKRMVLEFEGEPRTEVIATFDDSGAHLSRVAGGIAKNSDVARAQGSPWGDASEFWLLRDRPKVGANFRTLLFSLDTGSWVLTEITYMGPKDIRAGGRMVHAQAIISTSEGKSTTAYVDDRGDPVLLELDGGIVMDLIPSARKKG